jgi:hypothetical protein
MVGQAGLDHRELVAAQAGHGVALAHAAAQALGGHAQQGVAQRVAQGVVDGLEAVQVDEVHRHLVALAGAGAARASARCFWNSTRLGSSVSGS